MPKLDVIIASTRPGRLGEPIARWAAEAAVEHGGFDVELIDLADVDLPLMDEPNHPRMRKYTKQHTHRWSETVSEADAFLFVTPEYNYGPPPALVNALNFLYNEWAYKPVGFVSYGGVAAGLRSVQVLKQIVTTLRMVPVPDGVAIPFVLQHVGPDGVTLPPPVAAAMTPMLDELVRWTTALEGLRAEGPPAPPPPPPGFGPPAPPAAVGGPPPGGNP